MTRSEVAAQYNVNSKGIIRSPGKFEGELLYVPHFWEVVLEGGAADEFQPEDGGPLLSMVLVTDEDRHQFPELEEQRKVWLGESDQGFVEEYVRPED